MNVKTNINIEINELARVIRYLSSEEIEVLTAKLNGEEKVLKKRLKDVREKKIKFLTKEEVFNQ